MSLHPRAGQPATKQDLVNVPRLISSYYCQSPDSQDPAQQVSFGTSGHRGSSFDNAFNETHILAICQGIVEYRQAKGIQGPLFLGMDTHALSEPAMITAVEVFCGNGVSLVVQQDRGYTPTPVISHAILGFNRSHDLQADGIVITPSHNPPRDGGFKYNPPHGGPADTDVTNWIQNRANQWIETGVSAIKRMDFAQALNSEWVTQTDLASNYINELDQVIDMQVIAKSGLKLGADPLGGAGMHYWERIAHQYKLNIDVVNTSIDPTFSFMRLDKDGQIRMDCSSPYAMVGLLEHKNKYDLSFGNDTDFDRHGIVSAKSGLMNPNHYLAVAIDYLYRHRPQWSPSAKIGKTLVSSSLIDRVATDLGRELSEMPVGFKWFVDGLLKGTTGFAGEESAGGIFLRRNGQAWATDKDGFILCLLGAEMMAACGKDPADYYQSLTDKHGKPCYKRVDVAASTEQKQRLKGLNSSSISGTELAGEKVTSIETQARGNQAPIGGVKVSTKNGWFAARPSGTESVYKIYAESFKSDEHLNNLLQEAENMVDKALK